MKKFSEVTCLVIPNKFGKTSKYSEFTHQEVTYICKQVTDVEFWSKIMHKLCFFLQQDTHTFPKQEDNKCTSADLQQGSN